jgi:hypothetical protein
MPRRFIDIDGDRWEVAPSGFVTQYVKDEFALVFSRGEGTARERRIARYSPAVRYRFASLATLSDEFLRELFRRSQPSWTSPELGYRR